MWSRQKRSWTWYSKMKGSDKVKLMWLCNLAPGAVREQITGKKSSGLWADHVLSDLRKQDDLTLHILCPHDEIADGTLDAHCSYACFTEGLPYVYMPSLEDRFCRELREFQPDVIHIWGTEYGHTLAMVNAAEKEGFLSRIAVSIQGLCSVYAPHYAEGVPFAVQKKATFRDILRRDNILQQQKKFVLRGQLEERALEKVNHVIGRTDWDLACTAAINPNAQYHFCNETLREEFYEGGWKYDACQKHRIFASSCAYPIKGFHYLLQAFAQVLKKFPDATLAVPGDSPAADRLSKKLRQSSYQKYLESLLAGMEDRVEFLGRLSSDEMKQEYLRCNVFALPSTIENSPNSLGEAMLLGAPCVAADVGGVSNMMRSGEGYIYQPSAPYMLAHYIQEVFKMEANAEDMGNAAANHAEKTHDPETNRHTLLGIYREVAQA